MPSHEWTPPEMNIFLSLLAKGIHIQGRGEKRNIDSDRLRHVARMDFVTALNEALNRNDFGRDISKREILAKLDEVLLKQKHVVGPGGLMERYGRGKITRSLTYAFKREKGMDHDGSLREWEAGRRLEVINKYRARRGMLPLTKENHQAAQAAPVLPAVPYYRKATLVDPGRADDALAPKLYRDRVNAGRFVPKEL